VADRALRDDVVVGVDDADRASGMGTPTSTKESRRGFESRVKSWEKVMAEQSPTSPGRFHRGRRQSVRGEQGKEGPRCFGHDGLAGVQDEAHGGEVPAAAGDLSGAIVDQAEGEIGAQVAVARKRSIQSSQSRGPASTAAVGA